MFGEHGPDQPNYLRFRVSPDISIALGAHAKKVGPTMQGREVELFVSQQQADEMEAYARLISEALIGDTAHFARQDEVEAAWAIVDPVLNMQTQPYEYTPGTWGPREADDLIQGPCSWRSRRRRMRIAGRGGVCAVGADKVRALRPDPVEQWLRRFRLVAICERRGARERR